MSIPFRCDCGETGEVPDAALHQYVKCPVCRRTSYIGSVSGAAVPVVHRADRSRRSRRRLLGRGLLVAACLAVVAGLAWGLMRERPASNPLRPTEEVVEAAEPDDGEPDVILTRIQRELEADPVYRQQYERLRQRLIDDYAQIDRQRRRLELDAAQKVTTPSEVRRQERQLRRREDQVHQVYLDWAIKVDGKVRAAVPDASRTLIAHWVSRFFPEPTIADVAREESADTDG